MKIPIQDVRRILKLNAYFIESYGIVKKMLFFYKGLKKKKSQNCFENFSKFDFKMIAIIGKSFFFIQIFSRQAEMLLSGLEWAELRLAGLGGPPKKKKDFIDSWLKVWE